jgi:hypothetical protein
MISVDTMEVLLRSVPQYFLFGAIAFFVFSWINKKPLYGLIAEAIMVTIALLVMIVMLLGYIPSPKTEGMNKEHLEMIIKITMFFLAVGFLSVISLLIRLFRKKEFIPLVIAIFVLSVVLFFQATSMSKVKFELNRPTTTILDSIRK